MLNEMMFRPVVKPEVVEYMRKSQRFFPGKLGELEQMANDLGIPIIPHETAVYFRFLIRTISSNSHFRNWNGYRFFC